MNNRETLEFAAKAAFAEFAKQILESGWDAFDSNEDAFTLAVCLGFRVEAKKDGQCYVWLGEDLLWNEFAFNHLSASERATAIRRAIVRAAAQIGKTCD